MEKNLKNKLYHFKKGFEAFYQNNIRSCYEAF